MKAELEASRLAMVKVRRETSSSTTQEPARFTAKLHRETSVNTTQEPARFTDKAVAPPGGGGRKLFSEIGKAKRFTITVTSKDNQTTETIKEILKTNINPTEIKVRINALKTLRDRRVLIETNTKEELETLGKDINDKYGDRLETHIN
jgi:hypothetical protein